MVYLIHFEQKLSHAQHYIGFAENDLEQRIEKHKSGLGAKILRAANQAGINWNVVKVWDNGDRTFERKLKNQKKARCLCPVCRNN
jgi:predicted GIY-YIG superfamily endonuclease